jgi:hypothetical protein
MREGRAMVLLFQHCEMEPAHDAPRVVRGTGQVFMDRLHRDDFEFVWSCDRGRDAPGGRSTNRSARWGPASQRCMGLSWMTDGPDAVLTLARRRR